MTNTNVMALNMQAVPVKGAGKGVMNGASDGSSKGNFDEALGRLQQEAQRGLMSAGKDDTPQSKDTGDGGSGREDAPQPHLAMAMAMPVIEEGLIDAPAAVVDFTEEAHISIEAINSSAALAAEETAPKQNLQSLLPQNDEAVVKNRDFLAMLSGDLTSDQKAEAKKMNHLAAALGADVADPSQKTGKMSFQFANQKLLWQDSNENVPKEPLGLALRQTAKASTEAFDQAMVTGKQNMPEQVKEGNEFSFGQGGNFEWQAVVRQGNAVSGPVLRQNALSNQQELAKKVEIPLQRVNEQQEPPAHEFLIKQGAVAEHQTKTDNMVMSPKVTVENQSETKHELFAGQEVRSTPRNLRQAGTENMAANSRDGLTQQEVMAAGTATRQDMRVARQDIHRLDIENIEVDSSMGALSAEETQTTYKVRLNSGEVKTPQLPSMVEQNANKNESRALSFSGDNAPLETEEQQAFPVRQGEASFQNSKEGREGFQEKFVFVPETEEAAVSVQATSSLYGTGTAQIFQQQMQDVLNVEAPATTDMAQTDFEVPAQIVEQARLIRSGENTEMVIHLKPEHLGDLTLKISVTENGAVTASFHSDNAQVRTIIENSLVQLRQELSDQGLKVDSVEVFSGLPDGQLPQGQGQQAWQQGREGQFAGERRPEDYAEEADDLAAAAQAQSQENLTGDGVDYRV